MNQRAGASENEPQSPSRDCALGPAKRRQRRPMEAALRPELSAAPGPPFECNPGRESEAAGGVKAAREKAAGSGGKQRRRGGAGERWERGKGGGARLRHGPEMPTANAEGGPLDPRESGPQWLWGSRQAARPASKGKGAPCWRAAGAPRAAGTGPWRPVPRAIPRLPARHQRRGAARRIQRGEGPWAGEESALGPRLLGSEAPRRARERQGRRRRRRSDGQPGGCQMGPGNPGEAG